MRCEFVYFDATRLAELIRTKEVSPVEIVHAHLDRIQAVSPKLAGEELGPLHGVPFTVNDSMETPGVFTQLGSPIFKGRIPGTDAVCVARLMSAAAILLAKANLPEYSYATKTDNLLTGQTDNLGNLNRSPGQIRWRGVGIDRSRHITTRSW